MKSFKWLFWTLLFILIFLAIDQFLVRVPPLHPTHAAFSNFYQDFRSRLFALTFGQGKQPPPATASPANPVAKKKSVAKPSPNKSKRDNQPSIETVIEGESPPSSSSSQSARYIYSDSDGVLQFADSLDEVPPQFRDQAQKL